MGKELDQFLNNKQKLYDIPLVQEDFDLIDTLMKHVGKIKSEKRKLSKDYVLSYLQPNSQYYSLPVKHNLPELDKVELDKVDFNSEYLNYENHEIVSDGHASFSIEDNSGDYNIPQVPELDCSREDQAF